MNSQLIPNSEDLKNTDFKNPTLDKKNKKHILLLLFIVAMFAMVFIPWFCIGISVEDILSVKLRAFGFQTWYGIVAGVLALLAFLGVVYKHLAVSFWTSVAAVVVALIGLNAYPTSRLVVDIDKKYEKQLREMAEYGYYDDSDEAVAAEIIATLSDGSRLKVPGAVVQAVALVIETIDQKAVYELIEREAGEELDEYADIINHRLGAILYLVFAALSSLVAYLALTRSDNDEKEQQHPQQQQSMTATLPYVR